VSAPTLGQRPVARTQSWQIALFGAVLVGVVAVIATWSTGELQPRTAWGRGFGVATAVLLAFNLAYSVRRRAARRGPGAVATWLRFHNLTGALLPLLMLVHTGLSFPVTPLSRLMWASCLWLALSGAAGRLIQRWIPRLLTSGLATEVVYERIPELVEAVRDRAEHLVAGADESLELLYRRIAPELEAPRFRWIFFVDITGGRHRQTQQFDHLRNILPEDGRRQVAELEQLVVTKSELDAHFTLQRALRWWVFVHAPVGLLLAVLVAFHIFSVLYY
jgi:hypothetical protein